MLKTGHCSGQGKLYPRQCRCRPPGKEDFDFASSGHWCILIFCHSLVKVEEVAEEGKVGLKVFLVVWSPFSLNSMKTGKQISIVNYTCNVYNVNCRLKGNNKHCMYWSFGRGCTFEFHMHCIHLKMNCIQCKIPTNQNIKIPYPSQT